MGLFDKILGHIAKHAAFDDKDCDWYCDSCGAYMNDQSGFTALTGTWICTECGCVNDVSENNIIDTDDDEEESESLSVYDAAEIWASNGKDEDYTFGYSEEELEEALSK